MNDTSYIIQFDNGTYLTEHYFGGDIYQLPGFTYSSSAELNEAKHFNSVDQAIKFLKRERYNKIAKVIQIQLVIKGEKHEVI